MTFRVGQFFVVDVELDIPLCPLDTRCTTSTGTTNVSGLFQISPGIRGLGRGRQSQVWLRTTGPEKG